MKTWKFMALCTALVMTAMIGSACKTVIITNSDGKSYTLTPKFDSDGGHHYVLLNEDMDDVFKATVKGLKELDINISEQKSDKLTAMAAGTLANGKTYSIKLNQMSNGVMMKLYFGDFGSNQRVQQIFKVISERF